MLIEPRDGLFHIRFPYNPDLIERVKQIPGRKWNQDTKTWTAPICLTNRSFIKHLFPGTIFADVKPPTRCDYTLYQPQIVGYQHQEHMSRVIMDCRSAGRSVALFAETGTGKTKAVLDALVSLRKTGSLNRTLVVCPRPLIGVWLAESEKWGCPAQPVVCHGTNRIDPTTLAGDNFFITSYGTFVNDFEKWNIAGIDIAIFDEAHLLKNKGSQRHKACRKFESRIKVPMTGTPYGNEHKDLWGIMAVSDAQAFGPWEVFANAFCIYGGWEDKEIVGYKNEDLMMKILQHSAIVIRKQDCLDLPPKQYQRLDIPMSPAQKRAYDRCLAGGVGDIPVTTVLAQIAKCRQIASGFVYGENGEILESWPCGKIDVLKEMCWDTPTVIWHNFTKEGDDIEAALTELGITHRRARGDGRAFEAAQQFEAGACQVLIAQLQTLQYGITVNRATRSIYYSGTFSSLDRSQSEDRNHRIGQQNSVLYIDLVSSPVEEWIYEACMGKIDVREHIMKKLKELENNA